MRSWVLFTVAVVLSAAAFSQDRLFTRTYQSTVLAKGNFDLEYWTTLRTGKEGENSPYAFGRYLDSRIELEFGLGSDIQTAFYFNTKNFKYVLKDSTSNNTDTQTEFETSFSNEWKFKLSDPVANSFGSALYLELTVASDEFEIEGKVILDKQIDDEVIALNIVGELELETEVAKTGNNYEQEIGWEAPVEIDLAYMHLFNPSFGLGVELRNHNEIVKDEGWEHSVVFAGPSLFFSQGKFWGAFNALAQIGNIHKTDAAPGNLVLDEHEKWEFRLLIGYSF